MPEADWGVLRMLVKCINAVRWRPEAKPPFASKGEREPRPVWEALRLWKGYNSLLSLDFSKESKEVN